MSVLVVGSVALDTVETPFGKVDDAIGGSATYFSAAASYFTDVNIVAVVGEDFPIDQIKFLQARGVNLDGLVVKPGKTFRWGGKYDFDLNQRETLFTHLNVFENFDPKLPEHYRNTPYLFLANIHPELQLKVLHQMSQPKLVVMDTMNFWIERTPAPLAEVLKRVDILIVNDSEVRQLAQTPNLFIGAKRIQKMGPKIIVMKKGEHGALLVHDGQYFWAPAFPLEQLQDPTGAGDTFAGGFVGYLAKVDDPSPAHLRKAVIYGSTLASFCVEQFSLRGLKNLSPQQIEHRYRQFIDMVKCD
ncbi:MAG: PfkB family carbohydrate kinase [candidate division KSB1 bacterium]|nr:PfkB family carbohydrate kinase [candidate division KSB1 bacterium]MDZ7335306.1 PfkB family carbohydrate kinase [candidate division KSB1 bacterium]MDZ7357230.1 PfkB family carbohydrate kinase [candidate division KSB1 bacterium]MDZ7375138.1 PfkB family carbohydrate kinase [candidate division KSB1 bacterium]MDZ7399081.1 PfkB family carbohydrate kinase [candidate division KSB1 bacterium]